MSVPRGGRKLKSPPRVKLLDPDEPLAPAGPPAPPPGKFRRVPGQLAMDPWSDDPGALVDPEPDGGGQQ